jgi:DNA polymerase-3 subunit gamma/tau
MSQTLYRKYRPAAFADVANQEHVKTSLRNQLENGSVAHAYLFTGPRGVGKTTVARLLAKAVNCEARKSAEPCNACSACVEFASGSSLDVYEIDAASHTQVDHVREVIIENVRFAPNRLKHKVFIIDEVHMLSTASFNALLKTLEEPPAYALFILATTEIHKVPATIISRCQRYDFKRIPTAEIAALLEAIAKKEGVQVDKDVLTDIAQHAQGGARDAESLLGQVLALGEKHVTRDVASLVLPATNTLAVDLFVEGLERSDAPGLVKLVNELVEQGVDLSHFTDDVIDALRDRLLERLAAPGNVPATIELLLEARRRLKQDRIPQLALELAIVKACGVSVQEKNQEDKNQEPKKDKEENTAKENIEKKEDVTVEPVAQTVSEIPVFSLDEVRAKWPKVFDQIKDSNASLPVVVQTSEISNVEGNRVELAFTYAMYVDTVNKEKNLRILEDAFSKVMGQPVRVKARHIPKEGEDVVAQLLTAFGGSAA